jgi:hypothetical protein
MGRKVRPLQKYMSAEWLDFQRNMGVFLAKCEPKMVTFLPFSLDERRLILFQERAARRIATYHAACVTEH